MILYFWQRYAILLFSSIAHFAYMPICLYFIIQIAYIMQIQSDIVRVKYNSYIYLLFTLGTYSVNYSIVRVLYIQPKVHVVTCMFLVTHNFRLYLWSLTIMHLQSLKNIV